MVRVAKGTGGSKSLSCLKLEVKGIVQGVGFRPFIYNLAEKMSLKGWVRNSNKGVLLELEGSDSSLQHFLQVLREEPPRLARIDEMRISEVPCRGYQSFEIMESNSEGSRDTLVSPDVAICGDCSRELLNPDDRRFHYPFTNCINCGPRFTIIRDLPYDRERTTMSGFAMCGSCLEEYTGLDDRRFHAQPNACPGCGPEVMLTDRSGEKIAADWLRQSQKLIKQGKIAAIKGLGGFHLACNALDSRAVEILRQRKKRPFKPFAVMCRDLDIVKKYCRVNDMEAGWLTSPQAPIVILERKSDILPAALAPNSSTLGVMLPYTPLHLLLFDRELEMLVMTSGNISGLPLVKDNKKALLQLGGIADFFLLHNREIYRGCDDSLGRIIAGKLHLYRRSRGFVPEPLQIPVPTAKVLPPVLGVGGEMKNTFCLVRGGQAFLSQHLGELQFREGTAYFQEALESMKKLLGIEPGIIAYDLHPGYQISALARQMPGQLIAVQHHHAHLAACMAENGLHQEVIGVICDGTGYGTDGAVWGFEILTGDFCNFQRRFHLRYLPMPGGEKAVKYPWRMAVSYLYQYLGSEGAEKAVMLFPDKEKEIALLAKMLERSFNSPLTSSCGRLFDAVSALLDICRENSYEGQAAVELAELFDPSERGEYPFKVGDGLIDPEELLGAMLADRFSGKPVEVIASRFHNTVISMIVSAVLRVREETALNSVVLSGGTFQNCGLILGVRQRLEEHKFHTYFHRKVPANDGGLSLGQAMAGLWQAAKK